MITKDDQKPPQPFSVRSVDQASSTGASEAHSPWVSLEPKHENAKPLPDTGSKIGNDAMGQMGDTIGTDSAIKQTSVSVFSNLPPWLKTYSNPMKATVVVGTFYGNLRSLSEFLMPSNFSKPTIIEALQRLKANGKYFWANYCVLSALITIISIITKPTLLIAMGILTFMWMKVFDDDFKVCKLTLGRKPKTAVMTVLSVLGLIYFASTVIIWSLGSSAVLAALHASFHLSVVQDYSESLEDDLELGFLEK